MAQSALFISRHIQVVPRTFSLPPAFLIPSFSYQQSAKFSSTPLNAARKDGNRMRGVSALRRTGPRKSMTPSVDPTKIPRPVKRDPFQGVEVDYDHGLYDFFHERDVPFPPTDVMNKYGRAWTTHELRNKDWDDLHKLWWTCIKENNRLATARIERERVGAGYGEAEEDERRNEVSKTMVAIKAVLTERQYAWEDARKLAATDPQIEWLDGQSLKPKPRDKKKKKKDLYIDKRESSSNEISTIQGQQAQDSQLEQGSPPAAEKEARI